jgi:hypothetical protein
MKIHWLVVRSLVIGLLFVLALGVTAQDSTRDKKSKGKEQPDPPRTTVYMNQLRQVFGNWDRDKDNYLDKKELAIAFRGAGAKPYDSRETKDSESKTEDKTEKDKSTSDRDKPKKTPDYSKYPDYQFLTQVDRDRDDRIGRDEFLEWAREYAMKLRDQAELQQEVLKLQKELQKLPRDKDKDKAKNRKQIEAKLRTQQQQIDKLRNQLKRYDKIHGHFKK